MRYCLPLVSALIKSLEKRFKGIFAKCLMVEHIPHSVLTPAELPFGNRAYFLAVFLDPRFSLQWVDIDVNVESEARKRIKVMIQGNTNRY